MNALRTALILIALTATGTAVLEEDPIALTYRFDSRYYSKYGFPRHCASWVAIGNPKKRRPLFVYGWGIKTNEANPDLTLTFRYQEGDKEKFTIAAQGQGTIGYNGYCATVLADWNDYAAASLLLRRPRPLLYVTFANVRDIKGDNEEMSFFFSDDKKRVSTIVGLTDREPVKPGKLTKVTLTAVAEINITAGELSARCEKAPISFELTRSDRYWSLAIFSEFTFKGSDLMLSDDDAGDITLSLHGKAYAEILDRFHHKSVGEKVEEILTAPGEVAPEANL
jgi:hypothetical protein